MSRKLDDDSADGENWYWYERFAGGVTADAVGADACRSCHSSYDPRGNSPNKDLVFSNLGRFRACEQHNRPHADVCTATPGADQDCVFSGPAVWSQAAARKETLYYVHSQITVGGAILYAINSPRFSREPDGGSLLEGDFQHVYCAGDFPKDLRGSVRLSADGRSIAIELHTPAGVPWLAYTGRARG